MGKAIPYHLSRGAWEQIWDVKIKQKIKPNTPHQSEEILTPKPQAVPNEIQTPTEDLIGPETKEGGLNA